MKNLLDKPYKTTIYLVSLLVFSVITLRGDNHLPKTDINTPQLVGIIQLGNSIDEPEVQSEEITPTEILVAMDDVTVNSQVRRDTRLSRGGPPPKPKSEREIINGYVADISKAYEIDPYLIMSVIEQESEYNPRAKNGNCLGLMQVSSYWHKDRAERLGVTDFYDPYGNILLGVDYICELRGKYKDIYLVLMLYNMEHKTAFALYNNGQVSYYARTIVNRAERYRKGE
jgi:hypothetical protein